MIRPGPFLSLIHGDPCPDNNRIYGDNAVLLDFQVAAVDHCLIDAAIFTAPFPNCWCVCCPPRWMEMTATRCMKTRWGSRRHPR